MKNWVMPKSKKEISIYDAYEIALNSVFNIETHIQIETSP